VSGKTALQAKIVYDNSISHLKFYGKVIDKVAVRRVSQGLRTRERDP
jgi:hypothetical protein